MTCPKCGKEMRKGYLFSSKDGAFSFADKVPGAFENAKGWLCKDHRAEIRRQNRRGSGLLRRMPHGHFFILRGSGTT